jgi:hypothetical protein
MFHARIGGEVPKKPAPLVSAKVERCLRQRSGEYSFREGVLYWFNEQ